MQWDTITDQPLWFSAAAVFLVLFGSLAAHLFHRPKAYNGTKPYDVTKPYDAIESQDGWVATGRVDFFDPQSSGNFILRAEETRIVGSTASVKHRAIRWRTATLEEADRVLVAYHADRLATATNFIVTSSNMMRRDSIRRIEQAQLEREDVSE